MSRIVVVGCGHVGLVFAAGFARLGHAVTGIDRDATLVDELNRGVVRIHEPGLTQLVQDGIAAGTLGFCNGYRDVADAEFVFLAVDTPPTTGGAADLRSIRSAIRSIAGALDGGDPVIVNKCTSPIGTGETIEGIFEEELAAKAKRPRIVANPEFLQQGRAVADFVHPDRIVVGARDPEDARAVAALYEPIDVQAERRIPVIVTDLRTAEMVKYVANAFLATRISFVNEIARLCDGLGVDVEDVVRGVENDARIGNAFFRPGIGFGGSCLPKDVMALRYMGETLGVQTPMLTAVLDVNKTQRTMIVRRLRTALGGRIDRKRIAVWGVAFKGGTEDVRESPAVELIELLLNEGAKVVSYDPSGAPAAPARVKATMVDDAVDAVRGADALVVASDWPDFGDVPLGELRAAMIGNVIVDGRNVLDQASAEREGFVYQGVGRGRPT